MLIFMNMRENFPTINSFHVIRILEVRVTVFFTNKMHALNS
jgi:hypothetical protein